MGESLALGAWKSRRAIELDRMESVHASITGGGRGRRWDADHLNYAVITRLVAEFQGFARDLHDESVEHVVDCLAIGHPGLAALTRTAYIRGRELSSGNPTWNALSADFGRLEMNLKVLLDGQYARAVEWRKKLVTLLYARNAIVHADEAKLLQCKNRGDLTLRRAREWRSSLKAFASGLDRVTGAHLKHLTGTEPW